MEKTKRQKPSYNCLRESLRCANAEAGGYLESLNRLRREVGPLEAELKTSKAAAQSNGRLVRLLVTALEDAQAKIAALEARIAALEARHA